MKKLYFFIFLCVVLIFCAIGCADESSSSEASENTPPNSVETENDPTDSTQTVDTITPEEAQKILEAEAAKAGNK